MFTRNIKCSKISLRGKERRTTRKPKMIRNEVQTNHESLLTVRIHHLFQLSWCQYSFSDLFGYFLYACRCGCVMRFLQISTHYKSIMDDWIENDFRRCWNRRGLGYLGTLIAFQLLVYMKTIEISILIVFCSLINALNSNSFARHCGHATEVHILALVLRSDPFPINMLALLEIGIGTNSSQPITDGTLIVLSVIFRTIDMLGVGFFECCPALFAQIILFDG